MRTAVLYNFFIEANVMATIAIVLMMVLRKFVRKPLGNGALCFGWMLVAVRLLCPLALQNPVISEIRPEWELDTAIRPISAQVLVRTRDTLSDVYRFSRRTLGIAEENVVTDSIRKAYQGMYNGEFPQFLMVLYAGVLAVLLGGFICKNVQFRMKMKKNRVEPLSGELLEQYRALCSRMGVKKPLPVYFTDPLPSASLVGVLKPYIVLPLTAAQANVPLILEHELCHYKNRDHLWAMVRLVCCLLHWFNPLVWLAARMSRTDMELRCDDRVIRNKDESQKKTYAAVLVMAAARKTVPGLSVLATGMTMTGRRMKKRVQQIIGGGKAVKAVSVAFMVLASMLLVGAFATAEMNGTPLGTTYTSSKQLAFIPPFEGEMLYHFENLDTDEKRIEAAVMLSAMPMMTEIDLTDVEWNVEPAHRIPNAWEITAKRGDEAVYRAIVDDDGEIFAVDNNAYQMPDGTESRIHLTDPWKFSATEFARDWLNVACSSMAENVVEIRCVVAYDRGGKAFCLVEAMLKEMPYTNIFFEFQLTPQVRIIRFSPGVG